MYNGGEPNHSFWLAGRAKREAWMACGEAKWVNIGGTILIMVDNQY
jgi:hypothetical protein